MKVAYIDFGGWAGTYHPQLGWLDAGKPFELSDELAEVYIAVGLLQKVSEPRKSTKKSQGDKK